MISEGKACSQVCTADVKSATWITRPPVQKQKGQLVATQHLVTLSPAHISNIHFTGQKVLPEAQKLGLKRAVNKRSEDLVLALEKSLSILSWRWTVMLWLLCERPSLTNEISKNACLISCCSKSLCVCLAWNKSMSLNSDATFPLAAGIN